MANKTAKIEARVLAGEYESAKTARTAVTRSKLHGKVKKRLHAIIDTWGTTTGNVSHVQPGLERRAEPVPVRGPTHVSADAIDRCAMLLLKFAVIHKLSMDQAFSTLQKRIMDIAIDG